MEAADGNMAIPRYECLHFSRTMREDKLPELLRRTAADIEQLEDASVLDVSIQLVTATDEATVSVYYYFPDELEST
jgi:hypothetical protein